MEYLMKDQDKAADDRSQNLRSKFMDRVVVSILGTKPKEKT